MGNDGFHDSFDAWFDNQVEATVKASVDQAGFDVVQPVQQILTTDDPVVRVEGSMQQDGLGAAIDFDPAPVQQHDQSLSHHREDFGRIPREPNYARESPFEQIERNSLGGKYDAREEMRRITITRAKGFRGGKPIVHMNTTCEKCGKGFSECLCGAVECPHCHRMAHEDPQLSAGEWRRCDRCGRQACFSCLPIGLAPRDGAWIDEKYEWICSECWDEVEEEHARRREEDQDDEDFPSAPEPLDMEE